MFEFMKLEMRKNRLLFWGIVVAFFGMQLFLMGLAAVTHESVLQLVSVGTVVCGAILVWCMPPLYGATSGAGLRNEPAMSAEAGLPLSPGKKMAGALAAMGFYFICLTAIWGLCALLLDPYIEGQKFSLPTGTELWQIGLALLAALLSGFLIILICFTCAYAFRHSILGGLIGILLFGVIAAGMIFGAMTHFMQGADTLRNLLQSSAAGLILIPLLTASGTMFALYRLAGWGERRVKPGWSGWLLISLGLGCGAFSATGWLANGYTGLSRQLLFQPNAWQRFNNDPAVAFLDVARKARADHQLLITRNGSLVSIADDGKRTVLLPEDPRNPVELVKEPWVNRIASYAWDADGSLWALVRTEIADDSQLELWHGGPDAPLKSHTFFKAASGQHPYRLAHRGSVLGVVAWTDGREHPNLFAPIPSPGKLPAFETLGEIQQGKSSQYREDDYLLEQWIEAGTLARVSDDDKSLVRKTADGGTQTCTFPEGVTALHSWTNRRRLMRAGGKAFFLVGVSLPDGSRASAVCDVNGTVRLEWRGKAAALEWYGHDEINHLRFGYIQKPPTLFLFMLTKDGQFLPPLSLDEKTLFESAGHPFSITGMGVVPLWTTGTHVWLKEGFRSLLEVDVESGKLVKQWSLPNFNTLSPDNNSGSSSLMGPVTASGFHYIAAGRIYHAGFDGVTKDLGPARLE